MDGIALPRAVSKNVLYFICNEGRADQTNALLRSFCSQEIFLVRVQCSGELVIRCQSKDQSRNQHRAIAVFSLKE